MIPVTKTWIRKWFRGFHFCRVFLMNGNSQCKSYLGLISNNSSCPRCIIFPWKTVNVGHVWKLTRLLNFLKKTSETGFQCHAFYFYIEFRWALDCSHDCIILFHIFYVIISTYLGRVVLEVRWSVKVISELKLLETFQNSKIPKIPKFDHTEIYLLNYL